MGEKDRERKRRNRGVKESARELGERKENSRERD